MGPANSSEESLSLQSTLMSKVGSEKAQTLKSLLIHVIPEETNGEKSTNRQNARTTKISIKNLHCATLLGSKTSIWISETAHFLLTRTKYSHTFIQTNLPGHTVVPSDRAFWAESNKQYPDRKQPERKNDRVFWHYLLVEKQDTLFCFSKLFYNPDPKITY